MTKKILSGAYASGYTLSAGYRRLVITSQAELAGAVGRPGVYTIQDEICGGVGGTGLTVEFAAKVENRGAIVGGIGGAGSVRHIGPGVYGNGGDGGIGVMLAARAQFANRGGTIVGGTGGQGALAGGGNPHNRSGYGGVGGAAIYLANDVTLDNASGAITGGAAAATRPGGADPVGSHGVDGGVGVVLRGAGFVANAGVITGGAAGSGAGGYSGGKGGAGGAGLVAAGALTLVNQGTVAGGAGGVGGVAYVPIGDGGSGGDGGAGAVLDGGGAVINTGFIGGGAAGAGGAGGAYGFQGAYGQQGDGVTMAGDALLTNGGATNAAAQIIGAVGVAAAASGAATVDNFGTIEGTSGVSVALAAASDRLIAEAGSTCLGVVAGGGGTLELAKAGGTITGLGAGNGAVTGGVALSFGGFGGLAIDTGGSWTLSGALTEAIDNAGLIFSTGATAALGGPVTNDGILETSGAGATLTVTGAVTGSGRAFIDGGTLDFASAFSQDVLFWGESDVLELGQSQGFGGTISNFWGSSQLDLVDIAFTRATQASFSGGVDGGVLTVTDGSHTAKINLADDDVGDTFTVASDNHGGTLVAMAVPGAPSVHAFASAMAGVGALADAAAAIAGSFRHQHGLTMLAHPAA
jgi:hypothetical protein